MASALIPILKVACAILPLPTWITGAATLTTLAITDAPIDAGSQAGGWDSNPTMAIVSTITAVVAKTIYGTHHQHL